MDAMAPQITNLTIVYLTVYSGGDQWKHQSPASLAFVRRIHRRPETSPHNGPVTRKMLPFGDVIMSRNFIIGAILVSALTLTHGVIACTLAYNEETVNFRCHLGNDL